MRVVISDEVRTLCPAVALGLMRYEALVEPSGGEQLAAFERSVSALENETMDSIAQYDGTGA